MPDPPPVGFLTRYLLENPYPAGLLLAALAVGLAWSGVRALGFDAARARNRLLVAAALLVAGVAVLATGAVVVTAGEQARRVVLELVDAAVAGDVDAAGRLFADDAALAFGSPRNPGLPRDAIERRIERLDGSYRVASNEVTRLGAYTESATAATVHLSCRTELEAGYGPVPTSWVLRVERRADGTWKIVHVTWVAIAGRTPTPDL